jgi:hypothetical protein
VFLKWLLGLFIFASLVGCSGNNANKPLISPLPDGDTIYLQMVASIREAAWNNLSKGEKESLINDWRLAEVKEVKWNEVPLVKTNKEPEKLYKITFNTKMDAMLGPIGIYIDASNNQVVGYDVRE